MTNGGTFDFLVHVAVVICCFAHIFFISDVSKFESFQRYLYFKFGAFGCLSWKYNFDMVRISDFYVTELLRFSG